MKVSIGTPGQVGLHAAPFALHAAPSALSHPPFGLSLSKPRLAPNP